MGQERGPRVDPRMVFALVLLAIPLLYLVAQVILVRDGDDCVASGDVGGLSQLFLPGDGCEQPPAPAVE